MTSIGKPGQINDQAQALLDLIESVDAPEMNTLSVSQARAVYRDRRQVTQPDPPACADVQDITVHDIPVRRYRPRAVGSDMTPALVYFHGGGWTIGDLDTHDTLCRTLANESGIPVYAVDYRMGPEHKFPTAVLDCWQVFKGLTEQADSEQLDPERIAVGGDSAGGNLAAVVSLLARDKGGVMPCFQLLIYPATDQTQQFESHQRNGQKLMLTTDLMLWFRDQYHSDPSEYKDWRASPLMAQDHSGLPPACILTAGFDPLVDEGKAYAGKLKQAGVPVESICYEGQIHGFITMGRMIEQANEAVITCAGALRAAVA